MARITVHAVHADGELRRWTLSERIVAEHLNSEHYTTQLLERLTWAAADAEAIEAQAPERSDEAPERSLEAPERSLEAPQRSLAVAR